MNVPLRVLPAIKGHTSYEGVSIFSTTHPGIVIETIKKVISFLK